METKKRSYAKAKDQLEKIVEKIESDQLNVDELTQQIKEAADLINFCKQKLQKTDDEIKKILEDIKD